MQPLKEPINEVKKEPEPVATPAGIPGPASTEGDKEEKKSNGAHTPV